MTLDELTALPPDALIYLPTGWDVTVWRPGGAVAGGNWYTLLHPPDKHGVIDNRKPVYYPTVELLLIGSTDEREAWRNNLEQLQARIDTIKQHKLKMKTKKGWDESNINLDLYMPEPCEIDEEMYSYIGEVVAPRYLGDKLTQGGDPDGTVEGEDGEKIFTYMTVSEVNGKYFYLGVLPEFKQ